MIKWIKKVFTKNYTVIKTPSDFIPKKKFDFAKWDGKFADISHWEPNLNISKYDYPILLNKCSDGINFVDKTHAVRKKLCKENGILYGGYHFYQCGIDPEKQATFYIISHGNFEINPILDFETDRDQNDKDLKNEKENCLKFLNYVKELTGKTPIIYTGLALAKFLTLDERFAEFPLWIAAYRSTQPLPPSPWKDMFAWQYSDNDTMKGIGRCDSNIYNKKMDLFNLKGV